MLPFSPLHLIFLFFFLGLILAFLQLGLLTLALDKLGISATSAISLLICSLLGSLINLPLFSFKTEHPKREITLGRYHGILRLKLRPFQNRTTIAINVGGALIPIFMSIYLLRNSNLDVANVLIAVTCVSVVCYFASKPIPGLGIGMPILVAPVTAAIVGLLLGGPESAPLAYICGTLGVLIGADILRLRDIQALGTPVASIGGAGTFDGIFLTGIVATLLA